MIPWVPVLGECRHLCPAWLQVGCIPPSRVARAEPLSVLSAVCLQGRVRTKTVKKASRVIIEKYYNRLTLDFDTNKRICEEVAIIQSKRLRNKISGFTTVSPPLPWAGVRGCWAWGRHSMGFLQLFSLAKSLQSQALLIFAVCTLPWRA